MTPSADLGGWRSVRKVAFFDPLYPDSLVHEHGRVAAELQTREGYLTLDAGGLRLWMSAQTGGGASGTVCALCHGIAPDTVAERPSADCLLRRYMEAGGLVLWIGDTAFTHQGTRGGVKYWGDAGHLAVLGFSPVLGSPGEVEVTRAGREWGLTYEVDNTSDCARCADVTVVLSEAGLGLASSYLKNFNPRFPLSGFLKYRAAAFRGDFERMLEDIIRMTRHALGEDDDAASGRDEAPAEPEPSPSETPAPAGELVETGSFRVDRSRALEKLSRFQLPDPALFLLPWVRWAVASGASEIAFRRQGASLEMRFDGAPLGLRELKDPYRYIFEPGDQRGTRCRQLALGILNSLRLKPRLVRISSGEGGARATLRLTSFADQEAEEARDGGTHTVAEVRWDGLSVGPARKALVYLKAHCRACPIRISIDGVEVPRSLPAPAREGLDFAEGRRRGRISVPDAPPESSLLEVHVLGVLAGTAQFSLPLVQVAGWVNDDSLALNASQTGVVRDENFATLEAYLGPQAERLLLQTIERQRGRMRDAGYRLLNPELRALWSERVERGAVADRTPLARRLGEAVRGETAAHRRLLRGIASDLRWDARVAAWLRDACRRRLFDLRQYELDSPPLKALWDAPVHFGVRGEPLSWRQIEGLRHSLRRIPFSREPAPWSERETVVWRVCPGELRELSIRYGDVLLDVTSRLAPPPPPITSAFPEPEEPMSPSSAEPPAPDAGEDPPIEDLVEHPDEDPRNGPG